MTPSIGRIVHCRLPETHGADTWRPAIIVNGPWGGLVNLTVFLDGLNDCSSAEKCRALAQTFGIETPDPGAPLFTTGSRAEGDAPGCWRWPPRHE